MNHRFQCSCGTVRGELAQPERAVRAACYCTDCQTYAHLLGPAIEVLDTLGGTEVVATRASCVHLSAGAEQLACLSLSPNGLLRWYARCCDTPIANTPRNWKLPYVGMVHACLHHPDPLERTFPTVQLRTSTNSAKGTPPAGAGLAGMARLARMVLLLAGDRLAGRYRHTPFFDTQGAPVAPVTVADPARVQAARLASGAA